MSNQSNEPVAPVIRLTVDAYEAEVMSNALDSLELVLRDNGAHEAADDAAALADRVREAVKGATGG